jgi:hypothetical protein
VIDLHHVQRMRRLEMAGRRQIGRLGFSLALASTQQIRLTLACDPSLETTDRGRAQFGDAAISRQSRVSVGLRLVA